MVDRVFESLKIPQSDKRLPLPIRKWGCYFRSLCGIAETFLGEHLTIDQIINAYDVARSNVSIMNSSCFIGQLGTDIVHIAGSILGVYIRAEYVGYRKHGIDHMVSNYQNDKNASIICKVWPKNKHFVQGDRYGVEVFNPYPSTIPYVYDHTNWYTVRVRGLLSNG